MELTNKIIAFLGDSLTEGVGTTHEKYRYDSIIREACGLKAALNYGVGGTRIAHQRIASERPRWDLTFCGRAYLIRPEAELVVVFGGTNDYGHGDAPFGQMTDTTPDTYCGAVDFLMRLLLESGFRPVFLTPPKRQGGTAPSDHPYKQPDARPLAEYARVIQEKGAQYGISVLDVYNRLDIDPDIPADREAYTVDGLHLNDAGQAKLAQLVAQFLLELD